MKKTLLALSILATLAAQANEHKHDHDHEKVGHIGAHVHGEAQLNVVLEDKELTIALETPAMNVMGFEYEPKTEEDLEKSHDALHALKDAEWLVINGGKCELHDADVDWQYAEAVHAHFHKDKEHGEHKHEEHKHEEHKHEEHEHSHAGHQHEEGETHSDVDAKFDFDCQSSAVEAISVNLFDAFPGFEKLNVQWIVGDKQGAQTLTASSRVLKLQ